MVKLIRSNLLNQINLIRYTAKFDTFLFDQISLIKFQKNRTCSISSNFTSLLYATNRIINRQIENKVNSGKSKDFNFGTKEPAHFKDLS